MTYYELLGIERGASPEAIRHARNRLLRRVHPDIPQRNRRAAGEAEETTRRLNAACAVLLHPDRRRAYDLSLDLVAGMAVLPQPALTPPPAPPIATVPKRSLRLVWAGGVALLALFAGLFLHRPVTPAPPPAPPPDSVNAAAVLALGQSAGGASRWGVGTAGAAGWVDTGIPVETGDALRAVAARGHARDRWVLRLNGAAYGCQVDEAGCASEINYAGPRTSLFLRATTTDAQLEITIGPAPPTVPIVAATPVATAPIRKTPDRGTVPIDLRRGSVLQLALRTPLDAASARPGTPFIADVAAGSNVPAGMQVEGQVTASASSFLDLECTLLVAPNRMPGQINATITGVRGDTIHLGTHGRLFVLSGPLHLAAGTNLRLVLNAPVHLDR